MRSTRILTLFFVLIPFVSQADLGASYKIQVSILTKPYGKIEGYYSFGGYDFYLEKDSSYHFFNRTQRINIKAGQDIVNGIIVLEDNQELFDYIFYLTEDYQLKIYSHLINIPFSGDGYGGDSYIPKLAGTSITLKKDDISSFKIKSITYAVPGVGIMLELTSEDQRWVKGLIGERFLGETNEVCAYTALVFQEPMESVNELMTELEGMIQIRSAHLKDSNAFSKEEIESTWERILDKFENLYTEGILVLEGCAC
ncbi:MAG: hypothetical protein AAFN93_02805 [Bacteroidota bacterium]